MAALGFLFHFFHDRQGAGSGADHQLPAFPGDLFFDSSAELYEPNTLTPAGLVSIAVTPGTPTLPVGATQQFIATGTFSDGSSQTLASVTWSSSDTSVSQISSDSGNHGLALGVAMGTATITANAGAISGTATLTVTPAQPAARPH